MPVSSEIWAFQLLDRQHARGTRATSGRPSTSISCSGSGSDTPPRAASRALPQLADLREQRQQLAGAAPRRSACCTPRSRAWRGCAPAPARRATSVPSPVRVDLDRPEQRRPVLRRAAARPRPRRAPSGAAAPCESGAVQRLPAPVRLHVERVARRDEGRHVGDRVVHDVAVAVALDVHRLVEVHRARRVDGHERDVGAVEVGQPRAAAAARAAAASTSVRELRRHVELVLDAAMPSRSASPSACSTFTTRLGTRIHPSVRSVRVSTRVTPVLILLPPSEGKASPRRGRPLDLPGARLPGPRAAPRRGARRPRLPVYDGRAGRRGRGCSGSARTQTDDVAANAGCAERPDRPRPTGSTAGCSTRPSTSPSLDGAARRRATSLARGDLGPVRAGAAGRPDPGVPARRATSRCPGSAPSSTYWRRRARRHRARGRRPRAGRRPAVLDVRVVLAPGRRTWPAGW